MKTPTITPIPLTAQVEAAEAQVRYFRHRRAELQEEVADLRDQQQVEMRRVLGTGGTSLELKAIRAKVAEAEALVDQADQLIADADRLVVELHAQLAAARTDEEKATHAAELARRSSTVKARTAELSAALEAAAKAGGAVVIALSELEQIDLAAANRLGGEARHLDPNLNLFTQGWKQVNFLYGAFEWLVQPLVPPVAGLDGYPGVGIKGYLAARDAVARTTPGAQQ